jgi:KaiC/GvpD/RAD55 family RecA-like ATPase
MIDKTRLGLEFFDQRFGGIYRQRATLCVGRHGSGKTLAALHALMQSVKEGERGLMLSAWHSGVLCLVAEQYGFPLAEAVRDGQIILLEYARFSPEPELEISRVLPPGSFMEFEDVVVSNNVRRVVIDTVLPWIAIRQEDQLAKHVYSFLHALERMDVTAFLTMPRPVSPLAFALKNRIEQQAPVVFTLDVDAQKRRHLLVNRYLGQANLPPPLPIAIEPGRGIVPVAETPPPPPPPVPATPRDVKFAAAFRI